MKTDTTKRQRCEKIMQRLAQIADGHDIVDFLYENDIEIAFDDDALFHASSLVSIERLENGQFIYQGAKIIINTDIDDDNALQAVVHETQHLRHHFNELGNPKNILSLEDHKLLRALQEADAQATAIDVTYKMKVLHGDDAPFQSTCDVGYAEMGRAYERAYQKDPEAMHNGEAKRKAFEAWFENKDRIAHYNRDTEEVHEPFLQSLYEKYPEHGMKKGKLTNAWLKALGALSSQNYLQRHETERPLRKMRRLWRGK